MKRSVIDQETGSPSVEGTDTPEPRGPGLLRIVIPICLSILILILLYAKIDPQSLLSSISHISPKWAVLYVLLSCIEPLVRAARWRALLGGGPFRSIAGAMYTGKACNNLFPLRMGDAVRVQYLKDKTGYPYRMIVASLIGETLMDLAFLAMIGILFALMAIQQYRWILDTALFVLLGVALSISIVLLLSKRGVVGKGFPGILHSLSVQVRKMASGRRGFRVLATTCLLWIYIIISAYCGLRMLLPSVSAIGVLGSIVFVYFAVLIPSAPGFIGSYHAAVAASLGLLGYSFSDYSSLPIVVHALQFIPQLIIGLLVGLRYVLAYKWRKTLADLNEVRKHLLKGVESD